MLIHHLETLNKRLVKNSIEVYIDKIREASSISSKHPNIFGVVSQSRSGGTQLIFQEDGSVKLSEERKRGVVHITDISWKRTYS